MSEVGSLSMALWNSSRYVCIVLCVMAVSSYAQPLSIVLQCVCTIYVQLIGALAWFHT